MQLNRLVHHQSVDDRYDTLSSVTLLCLIHLLGSEIPLHIIDVTVIEGLLDIIALGNLIEFATALDLRTYESIILPQEERLEIEIAMTRYRAFIKWFGRKFGLLIEGTWVTPSYLFKHCLVSFAAAVCVYFANEHSTTQHQSKLKGISPFLVKRHFRRQIQLCWPDLQPIFDHLLAQPSPFLYYTGPSIRIIRKTELNLLAENLTGKIPDNTYSAAPIYLPVQAPPSIRSQTPDPPAPKRPHNPTASATSPSQQKITKRRK